ncbi:UNVERIFIED_CONTAM: hypothetical protein Slati_1484600 [Sesamum latifolium]|uniref:Uncharacterized protein n=1 Tax=Sesamum latifolium TaxID=2727402 RepID=A0AAW2X905_9LAMI
MSIEALAMAGVNYTEIGITLEKLELGFFYDPPPSYLTAAEENVDQNIMSCRVKDDDADHDSVLQNEEKIKERIKEWAKAVASLKPINL